MDKKNSKVWLGAAFVFILILAGTIFLFVQLCLKSDAPEKKLVKETLEVQKPSESPSTSKPEKRKPRQASEKQDSVESAISTKEIRPLVKYEKKIIRKFEWNKGVDSLHKSECPPPRADALGDCGGVKGPLGLLANKNGDVYIFDRDGLVKLYDNRGILVRTAKFGYATPLGVDNNGIIYTSSSLYDSQLNRIKTFPLAMKLKEFMHSRGVYISDNGKLYVERHDRNEKRHIFYECNPHSDDLIESEYSAYKPPEWVTMVEKVSPYKEITFDHAPEVMKWNYASAMESDLAKIYLDKKEKVLQKIRRDLSNKKTRGFEVLEIDEKDNIYCEYVKYTNGFKTFDHNIAVFNKNLQLIGNIDICESSGIIDHPPNSLYNYIFIERHMGVVYQICLPDEERAYLMSLLHNSGKS